MENFLSIPSRDKVTTKEQENENLIVLQREADEANILLPTQYNRKLECPCANKAKYGGGPDEEGNFLPIPQAPNFTFKK